MVKAVEKKASGRELLAKMRAKKDSVVGDVVNLSISAIPTGNLTIDVMTGIGGLPRGRISTLYGSYSSGKTTSAIHAMAQAQHRLLESGNTDRLVVFVDYEHSYDPEYALGLGLDSSLDNFVYINPDSLEEGMQAAIDLINTGDVEIITFDSVAAMVPQKELDGEVGKAEMGNRAKLLAQSCRMLASKVAKYDTTAIFCNHVMEKIDTSFVGQQLASRGIKQWTSPGGTALPFYSSLMIFFEKSISQEKAEKINPLTNTEIKEVIGQVTKMTVTKNKVGQAYRTTNLLLTVRNGFSNYYSVYEVLLGHKVFKKTDTGTVHKLTIPTTDGTEEIKGKVNVLDKMEEDTQWFAKLEEKAREILEQHGMDTVDSSLYSSDGNIDIQAALEVSQDEVDEMKLKEA